MWREEKGGMMRNIAETIAGTHCAYHGWVATGQAD